MMIASLSLACLLLSHDRSVVGRPALPPLPPGQGGLGRPSPRLEQRARLRERESLVYIKKKLAVLLSLLV